MIADVRGAELFRLEIPGEAVPWPRARVNRQGRHYLPRPYVAWRDIVAMHLLIASREQAGLTEPTTDRLGLELAIYRRSKRRSDVDNYAKAIMDSGTGVVWADDWQIARLVVERLEVTRDARVELICSRLGAPT